ncbi:hypothetical protein, partial [Klebsiella pneumoniae]
MLAILFVVSFKSCEDAPHSDGRGGSRIKPTRKKDEDPTCCACGATVLNTTSLTGQIMESIVPFLTFFDHGID